MVSSCSKDDLEEILPDTPTEEPQPDTPTEEPQPDTPKDEPQPDEDGLKILAIGNSFTIGSTDYLPQLMAVDGESDIYFARLKRNSSSLEMHWQEHFTTSYEYRYQYISDGTWHDRSIYALDEVLEENDWDIIIIQQLSGLSGIYSSYQPYLDNLCALFRQTNTDPKIAWHLTWAYPNGSTHPDFKYYDYDTDVMYQAILSAGANAAKLTDIQIPSAQLIQKMRKAYPDVAGGFTQDGFHLSTGLAMYAVASLWHEVLITPYTHISCREYDFDGITAKDKEIVWSIIDQCLEDL